MARWGSRLFYSDTPKPGQVAQRCTGLCEDCYTFPLPAATHINLALRPFAASDPPITVNLPKLLYDFLRQRNP